MRATLEPMDGLSVRDVQAWRAAADSALEPNPFFHPDYVLPAARHLASRRVGMLVAGDWDGALPVVRSRLSRQILLPGVAAWRHSYCLLGEPLIAPDAPAGTVAALTAAPGLHVLLHWIWEDGPTAGALEAPVAESFERAVVLRRDDPSYTEGRMSGGRRKKLRRQARALSEELGGDLEVVDTAGSDAAVRSFLELEASGWKGREGTAMASSPAGEAFFVEVCRRFSERGMLQLLALRGGGRIAAMQANFRSGDGLFCFKVAFDEQLARHSPGVQLELLSLDFFHHRTDARWMDSCSMPHAELINRLWPDRRALRTVVAPASPGAARVVAPAVAMTGALRTAARRVTGPAGDECEQLGRPSLRPRPAFG